MQRNKDGEPKLFSLFGLFSLIVLCTTLLNAESFSEFKSVEASTYKDYRDQNDAAFQSYLKKQWKAYKASISPSLYKEKKPKSIAPLVEKKVPAVGPIIQIVLPVKKPIKPLKKEIPKKVIKEKQGVFSFAFLGSKLTFVRDNRVLKAQFYPLNQAGIANFFTTLASSDYGVTLEAIKSYKKRLALNDWGVYLLIKKLSNHYFKDENEAKIYRWFLFNKLSYDVKIALSENKNIYLLFYTKNIVYSTPRYHFGTKYYYIFSQYNRHNIAQIYTYEKNYPNAHKAFDFTLATLPNLQKKIEKKELKFNEYGVTYNFTIHYNKNMIAFMKSYPQVDYKIYFDAPMEDETYRDIVFGIKKYTDGKKISAAMNFVLRFVQKAFRYERDEEQFGAEKVMFAEETLYYNASDCEDRAILFAYLIKKIFGVRVLGVKYPNHMTTALFIPLNGDVLYYGKRRYVLADPTYINANIGQEMPKYRSIQPDSFIVLSQK